MGALFEVKVQLEILNSALVKAEIAPPCELDVPPRELERIQRMIEETGTALTWPYWLVAWLLTNELV